MVRVYYMNLTIVPYLDIFKDGYTRDLFEYINNILAMRFDFLRSDKDLKLHELKFFSRGTA